MGDDGAAREADDFAAPRQTGDLASPRPSGGAVFAPTAVVQAGRSRLGFALAVIVVVGALVAFGLIDRVASGATAAVAETFATSGDVTVAQGLASARAAPKPSRGDSTGGFAAGADVIALDMEALGSDLFIRTDVVSIDVALVTFVLTDGTHVAARQTVKVPGGSTAFRLGAAERLLVQFSLIAEAPDTPLVVEATAFDASGGRLVILVERVPQAA